MKERKNINWAEALRETIRRILSEPILPITVENLIRSLCDSNEWELLLCLYLKADLLNTRYVVRNLEITHPGKAAEIVNRLNSLLKEKGIDPNLNGTIEGQSLRDLIKDGLILHGIYDKFEKGVRDRLSEENWEVKEATWLLSQYIIEDPYRTYEFSTWIEPHGFIRTIEVMLDKENVTNIINKLVKIGLIFWDYYSSRAFSHEMIRIADYVYSIFTEFSKEDYRVTSSTNLLRDRNLIAFLKWLSGKHGFEFRTVMEYTEEEAKKEFKGSKTFDEVLTELIKKGIILIDYWPHRRRAGKRPSMPPYWVYRLTPVAKRKILPLLLIECVSKLELID